MSATGTLTAGHGTAFQTLAFTFNGTGSDTSNGFAGNDVTEQAGIRGVSGNGFNDGLPTLIFTSGLTGLSGTTPSKRSTRSYQVSYNRMRFRGKHSMRLGGDYQYQTIDQQSDSSPNGAFVFDGLYTGNGAAVARGSGLDFADFLLGLTSSASAQYPNCPACAGATYAPVNIHASNMSLFVNDDWRWKPRLTITLGLRYDLITPFTQPERQMANLDVDQAFNHVAVVQPGETGAYSGVYPAALVHADGNNVSPRVAGAWRANSRTTARFGYSILYNGGTYASIARSLYSQAPSFINLQSTGTSAVPLPYTVALLAVRPSTVTESYGIDKDYRLGMIQQFNVDISRDFFKTYQVGATWVGSIGRDLDVWLAPNQGPDGLRLQGVQSYLYEQSGGHSHANSLSARFQKRQSHGVAGTVNYTWQRARDNTTATSGGSTPAQNYADLDAEWAPSSFNRTNVVTGNGTVQLPWGANRHWLPSGGALAAIFGDWTLSGTVSLQSGTPLTALCACSNITAGAGSTLRADLVPGQTIALSDPVVGA